MTKYTKKEWEKKKLCTYRCEAVIKDKAQAKSNLLKLKDGKSLGKRIREFLVGFNAR